MEDTLPELKTMKSIFDIAEEQNLSVSSAWDEALERTRDDAINRGSPFQRGLYLNLRIYSVVINAVATERMRDRLRYELRQEAGENEDMPRQASSILLDVVEELMFDESVMNRHGDRVSIQGISKQLELENFDSDIIRILSKVADSIVSTINKNLIKTSQEIIHELIKIIPPEPTEKDMKNAYYKINQDLGRLDEEGRYLGDV